MADRSILGINNLTKHYGAIKAVDDVSLEVNPGEIVGLLGPNGAGKTTIINMILGILKPTSGSVVILGKDIKNHRSEVSSKMNFAAVYAHLPANLTVRQNLLVFGMLYGQKNLKEKISLFLQDFGLQKFADTKAGLLSSGETSLLSLAKAVINNPSLLLLDEPTASLDPSIARVIREKTKSYAVSTGAAILWTSHNMSEIEAVCDRVLFLSHGKILLSGNPTTLPEQYGKKNLEELFIAVAREPLRLEQTL
ncbi:MAG: ABC transporter ATP-binding protein [Proteobacteria bacterium]|nr:ABC transporter ATP-binding protein [Pseudomonadota bacterium]